MSAAVPTPAYRHALRVVFGEDGQGGHAAVKAEGTRIGRLREQGRGNEEGQQDQQGRKVRKEHTC